MTAGRGPVPRDAVGRTNLMMACLAKAAFTAWSLWPCYRGRGQRAALREARRDTAVTAESAWRSARAVRAEGSRRSAASARRWTSTRESGNAMDSSTHTRSRLDRNIHMRSILSVTASKPALRRTATHRPACSLRPPAHR
jgi:hypothetical protein